MLPNMIDEFEGKFWIEFEDGVCKIHVSIGIPEFTVEKKEELIDIAKNKKNAAAVGVVGKIRDAIESFFLNEETMLGIQMATSTPYMVTEYYEGLDFSYLWSLEQYRNIVNKEDQPEEWDELERSVIASVADDVIVGVKGKNANIIIVKKFA